MSRLIQHRKKQNNKKIIFLILLFGVIVLLIFSIGFDSLINTALFFTNTSQPDNDDVSSKQKDAFYGSIELDTPNIATTAATIVVSGQSTGFDQVEFYLNNVKAHMTELDGETLFSEEIGKLIPGENKIYAVGKTSKKSSSKKTDVFTVLYKSDAPILKIERPENNTTVSKQEIEIVGSTDRDTTVHLNNMPIVVDLKGEFVTTLRLKEGDNTLNFQATDIAGNTTETMIQVRYARDD